MDKYFGSVCELDVVYNFHKVYGMLDDLIIGGEIVETSKDLIVKKLGVDREKLVDDQPMTEFGLDSLSQAELLFKIEEHFKISVPENKYIVFTLKDLAMAVTEILEAPSSKDSIVAEMPKEKPLAPEITLSENPK